MRLSIAIQAAEILVAQYNLNGWTVKTDNSCRTLGRCYHKSKTIALSVKFIHHNTIQLVERTVKHEIAHALVGPGHAHGPVWKAKAIELGIPPTPCNSDATPPKGKFQADCPTCKRRFYLYKKSKSLLRWCKFCGRINGILRFIPTNHEDFMTLTE